MRVRAILGLFGVVVLAVVGALLYQYFSEPHFAKGSKVLFVGDSITYQSGGRLDEAVTGEGWRVEIDAVPGAAITGGGFQNVDWATRIRDRVRTSHPQVVVIELGTNGCGFCRTTRQGIDGIMRQLRSLRLVLWLNVREDSPWPEPAPQSARQINRALDDATHRWRNLRILDMNSYFHRHPELISPDHIHPTTDGQFAFGLFVAKALDKYLIK